MIVGVRGALEAVGPDWVHIQVGGVSLQVSVPASAIGELGSIGDSVNLHTQLRIQNEQPVLYGFLSESSLELFGMLNGVSGIGPRLALALLSALGVDRLYQAISAEDVAALSDAPGVGRRTAGRIILELKGKLPEHQLASAPSHSSDDGDVMAALTALGFSPSEARQAVSNLDRDPNLSVDDRILLALQQFGAGE
ncbi:MAG: Holliday junction branch migration protein RuvA [SAR202 cluster bacterium Io17-Chloro-G7]|nr:MAG: Holliday junction branch migration protein RuvA [SAR202 cluster bacterium Io17-Chloro-G7]